MQPPPRSYCRLVARDTCLTPTMPASSSSFSDSNDDRSVAILGAGLSGLAAAIHLMRVGVNDVVVYEREADVGGTWLLNTYPGLHCDIPSHLFCYSFAPNPDFSTVFSSQAEIQAYLRTCAIDYGVMPRIRFNVSIERATYVEERGLWVLRDADGREIRHRYLISATGGLTAPYFPKLEGRELFRGLSWHAGNWRHDVSLEGKTAVVIGSAASAVQVVPAVANLARKVIVFSRTPNWITPRYNRKYDESERQAFRDERQWRRVRRQQYRRSLLWHRAFVKDSSAIEQLRRETLSQMRASITDPTVVAHLTPQYPPGCKRILVSDDYYPAIAQPHVHLVPRGVTALSHDGVIDSDGHEHPADAVIYCTGYRLGGRVDGKPAVAVEGRKGLSLGAALSRSPEMYRGIAVPGFPNYFTICGINGAAGHAPVFLSAEVAADYVARWLRRLINGGAKSIEVKQDATRAYNREIQQELQQMSWADDCPGWYRDKSGRIIPFHPGTWARMRRELRALHEGDFDVA
ncbi:MAG: NAD(P)/FAD-dependent oxidoreductase [Pseudomonadota bacterium]